MLFKQVTQFNRIVKRGRSRLRNPFSALAIAAIIAAAAAAAILRTFTSEASPFLLDPFIKRLLMLTTVKALKCIKCINSRIISKSNKNCYNYDTSVIRCLRLNNLMAANRSPVTRSASSISLLPLAPAALIAFVAFAAFVALAAPVAFVALIIVAPFALVVALAVLAAAPAVAMTLAERRVKHMRAIKASRLTRERLINLKA
ncbi:hypothetical protein MBM_06966 [Drepanopeziza brunnea f. sp. 'multigermtubi' MB_m1]|uniref:Uncharacterized protein n=1 Tax=Marssonina brunnea f. sp. multigermtubi (strain MB_m1) TaxID=1072389 RepID=K1WBN3_MARBU|nr:uncharacterized protein MBM_06966 [Drepanopeziza brunnea f. sp. 'multigermtubi' MB_m1]EKD14755.1 hypothetical protein MBM_06966 [Drepanopeziza brunnea f. sp. 'multigermtubi' MB_m1]